MVTSYLNALNGGDADPRKTVVMGGGATGCEVAYHVAQAGADVTIVEQLPKMGRDLESMTRKMLFQKLQDLGAAMMTEAQVLRVADRGVLVSNGNGEKSWIEAQRVVVAVGPRPDTTLYEALQPLDYEIHRIGDCLEPRNAKTAILEGAIIGRKV
jgi:pyruvate/2-oxoglutarate dehydrogenase complex dihydrolipoamide dehydrogenase (E3) component